MSVADELKKLLELKEAGVLSEEEFDLQKAKLLDETPPDPSIKPASSADNKEDNVREEKTFWTGEVSGTPVTITSHRCVFPGKTLALANIGAVSNHKMPNGRALMYGAGVFVMVLNCLVALFRVSEGRETGNTISMFAIISGIALVFYFMGLSEKQEYSCQITIAGTSTSAVSSKNKAEIDEVVAAINEAIVHRNL